MQAHATLTLPEYHDIGDRAPLSRRTAGDARGRRNRTPQRAGAIIAIALHAAAAALLMTYEPARSTLLAVAPIMVEWISPPKPPTVRPQPPKPKPLEKPRAVEQPLPLPLPVVEPPPVLTTAASAPSLGTAPPPPPAPPAQPVTAAVTAAPAPVIVPPVFNADYLDNPSPPYPAQARRMGELGRVILRVLVNSDGRADEVQVRTSSGSARLDDSARETVKRWKFVPARRGSEAVPAWVLIPISFRLEG